MGALDKLEMMHREQQHERRQAKRAVWSALQTHLPELAARVGEIHRQLGPITAIKIKTREGVNKWMK